MTDTHEPDIELESYKRHGGHAGSSGSLDIDDVDKTAFREESVATAVLSWQEKKNLALLYGLYTTHDLPMAFTWWTMPILLRQQLSYSLIATFMISQYPYSVKVLWSPIVHGTHLPLLGRRKSWLVPCFFAGGLVLFWLAYHQDDLVAATAEGDTVKLLWLAAAWFVLISMAANCRIALDDWSLDLLSQANVHLCSTITTLAEVSGSFFSFILFLLLSSLGHPDAGTNGEEISTKPYFLLTGVAWVVVSGAVLFTQRDGSHFTDTHTRNIRASYDIILRILKLPLVWTLMIIHLTSMIGFMANDAIAVLQLVKNGFSDRDLAGLAAISIPLEIVGGLLISKTLRRHHPLHVWRTLFPYRLLVALSTQAGILLIHHYRTHHWRWFIALLPYLLSKQFENAMFIAIVSFHAQVADPDHGGIYLPLLATTLNIRYDIMGFIYTKTIGWIDGGEGLGVDLSEGSYQQTRTIDGYQIVNLCGVLLAIPVFWFVMRPLTVHLQGTRRAQWRVGDAGGGAGGVKTEYQQVRTLEEEEDVDSGDDEMEHRRIA